MIDAREAAATALRFVAFALALALIAAWLSIGPGLVRAAKAQAADPRYPLLEHQVETDRRHSRRAGRVTPHRTRIVRGARSVSPPGAAARAPFDANGNGGVRLSPSTRALVAVINAKLARWVHPTGKCGFASEQLATYYWQGARTATGARFNPHGLSAASRHLPFGTRLSITNPHNGRSVTVVINDRGPYTHAQLDLSLGAARALGLTQSSYVCVASAGLLP